MKDDPKLSRAEEAPCLYCESPDPTLSQVLRAEMFCLECGAQIGAALEGNYHHSVTEPRQ